MMWFSLADRLGRTVSDLKESMSVAEFHHWIAFHRIRREQLDM